MADTPFSAEPKQSVEVNFPMKTIEKCLSSLKRKDITEIFHPLPRPKERSVKNYGLWIWSRQLLRYTDEELGEYLLKYLKLSNKCYREIVNYNFPGLKHLIIDEEILNADIFLHIDKRHEEDRNFRGWPLRKIFKKPIDRNNPQYCVTICPMNPPYDFPDNTTILSKHFSKYDEIFIVSDLSPKFEPSSDSGYLRHAVLRKNIFTRLNKKMDKIKEEIRSEARKVLNIIPAN